MKNVAGVSSDEALRDFSEELSRSFSGEIRLDRFSRLLYSTDASIYQVEPLGVLVPQSHDDVAAAVTLAGRYRLPLLPRGGGTSLAGQTVGAALVLDYSKYMNRILEVNIEEKWARVQPGVVLDQLNAHLRPNGWRFGPDVSTSNRATLGGMMGNNSCGSHSILYGKTIDHVREMRVLLSSSDACRFSELTPLEWERKATKDNLEAMVYRSVDRIARESGPEILTRFPKVMRRVGGYNLDRFVTRESRNLCHALVGSEGTLATYTEAVVGLVPSPKLTALSVVHFADMVAAMDAMQEILRLGPAAVELVDKMLLDLTRLQPGFAPKMTFVVGDPAAILIVEFYGESPGELQEKLDQLESRLKRGGMGTAYVRAVTPEAQANVWAIRKAGLGLLSSIRGDSKPLAFVEDTAVEPDQLSQYVARFQQILARHGTRAGFYGHASVGCLHIRPLLNLKEGSQVQKMAHIAAAVKDLVVEFKGAMSGEHGDGLARSHWNRELFGDSLYRAFCQLKAAFDPAGIMNPGKIVEAPPMTESLRYGPQYSTVKLPTYFDFTKEGGLARAVEQCNGMGACRKLSPGTMCPSYMVTREEEHSTRGRANLLRAALSGRLPQDEYTGSRMFEALDLCLECKACKTECPANVDMAKLKYEFLAHYNARHGPSLRARVFGNIAFLSRIGSATAPVSNWLLESRIIRRSLQSALGIHPMRKLPRFARVTFQRHLRKHPPSLKSDSTPNVVLFNDTFTNYNEPGIGIAALKLLESAGARVCVPEMVCCGRPLISKGLLDRAKENARKNIALLAPMLESGCVVVGCEPSCLLTLRDEYPVLVPSEEAQKLANSALLVDQYLVQQLEAGEWQPAFSQRRRPVLLHGHCHQKSLVGTTASLRLLRMTPGSEVSEIDSGCCGMAGSFGYEKEHYGLSLGIGEMRLFPAVRQAPPEAEIVASGISCRQQILHATGRKARHLAEVLAGALQ
jgi:FAD/FMN-containing dehydrogenase/Fe-S oxidoreductase